ncbi:MAG: hypothetical protein ACAH95_01380 [Fimbriimonas sp.]
MSWLSLESVCVRRYTVPYSYFYEALLFKAVDGKTHLVPTGSALYGRMDSLKDVTEIVASRCIPVTADCKASVASPNR